MSACRRLCDKIVDDPDTAYTQWEWAAPPSDASDEEDAEVPT